MKYSKVAVVVAGSVMAMGAGAAAPAFAAAGAVPSTTLTDGLAGAAQTLQDPHSPVAPVTGAAGNVVKAKNEAPQKVLSSVSHVPPMLGGVQLGGN
ncbi:hypothetical protein AB0436_10270 [Streptomyces sp. NPDC051322]|uniref:hypothetical protein n=1 Tax=Streptomyces sp. NPDC051322 TaxID=3154645 RepID=UPI0034500352